MYERCGWRSCPKHILLRAFDETIDNDEKVFSSKKTYPILDQSKKNHVPFETKMTKINILFMTKTAETPHPLVPHIPI